MTDGEPPEEPRRTPGGAITRRRAVALGLGTAALPSSLSAQPAWPTGPVTVVYTPGGINDINARERARLMSPILGQQIVVDNMDCSGALLSREQGIERSPAPTTGLFQRSLPLASARTTALLSTSGLTIAANPGPSAIIQSMSSNGHVVLCVALPVSSRKISSLCDGLLRSVLMTLPSANTAAA